jgi:predicted outer membrane repeat protein
MIRRWKLGAWIAGGVICGFVASAEATNYFVSASMPDDLGDGQSWPTAKKTVGAAMGMVVPGDSITVSNGTYAPISVSPTVSVHSVNGPTVTVIDGGTTNRGVSLGEGAFFSGFSVTNASATNGAETAGGGIWADPSVTISNCHVIGCSAEKGGGIYMSGFGLVVDTVVRGNSAATAGGGVYAVSNCVVRRVTASGNASDDAAGGLWMGPNCRVEACEVSGNVGSQRGGGLYIEGEGVVAECIVEDNRSYFRGGGIATRRGVAISRSRIRNNRAWVGGGIFADVGSTANHLEVTSSAVSGNTAVHAGAMQLDFSVVRNCTIVLNRAVYHSCADTAGSSDFHNCVIWHNSALSGLEIRPILINAYYSCVGRGVASLGYGNLEQAPHLLSPSRIHVSSPCRARGSDSRKSPSDIDRESWGVPVSMGCDEPYAETVGIEALSVGLSADLTQVGVGVPITLTAHVRGVPLSNTWKDGATTFAENRLAVTRTWASVGTRTLQFQATTSSLTAETNITVQVVETRTRYVQQGNANAAAPYTSWSTAAADLQSAAASAVPGDTIIVGAGTYSTGSALMPIYDNPARVCVPPYVTLKSAGGAAVTTIDGGGSLRCVYLGAYGELDGFTLVNGYTPSGYDGAGCFAGVSSVVKNCRLLDNRTDSEGGGIVQGHAGTVTDCDVIRNSSAYNGGGIYAAWENNLVRCTVISNTASSSGGGIYAKNGCYTRYCTVRGNAAGQHGGGYVSYGIPSIEHTSFTDNEAGWDGGGVFTQSEMTTRDCVFTHNTAGSDGGGYYGHCQRFAMTDCTFSSNSATSYGGGLYARGSTSQGSIERGQFVGNDASYGGGVYAYRMYVRDCTVEHNHADGDGGGVYADYYSDVLTCGVKNNQAERDGGGIYGRPYVEVDRSSIFGNSAGRDGGGFCSSTFSQSSSSGPKIYNSLLARNSAERDGGGVLLSAGQSINNTVVDNSAAVRGGGLHAAWATAVNTVICSNSASTNVDLWAVASNISYCVGVGIPTGSWNQAVAPQLIHVPSSNYRLRSGSPCHEAGNDGVVYGGLDLAGAVRKQGSAVDVGCYEGTHLAVVVHVYGGGSVAPAGGMHVSPLDDVSFTLHPDDYHEIGDVQVNGSPLGNASQVPLLDITDHQDLHVRFDPTRTVHDVPELWLASYGWTQDFAAVAIQDDDGDGHKNWEEYWIGTSPTNAEHVLQSEIALHAVGGAVVRWPSVTNIKYYVEVATGGPVHFAVVASNILPYGAWGNYTDSVDRLPPVFYRISGERNEGTR